MDPLTLAAIMGGVGLAKGELIDRPQEKRDRMVAAETARWSPWTGMQPAQVGRADSLGAAAQGGLQGYGFGQNMQNQAAFNEYLKSQQGQGAADLSGYRDPTAWNRMA